MKLKSMREVNIIRGKLLSGAATPQEVTDFLNYVNELEVLVQQASDEDFYGTDGWEHVLGLEE